MITCLLLGAGEKARNASWLWMKFANLLECQTTWTNCHITLRILAWCHLVKFVCYSSHKVSETDEDNKSRETYLTGLL